VAESGWRWRQSGGRRRRCGDGQGGWVVASVGAPRDGVGFGPETISQKRRSTSFILQETLNAHLFGGFGIRRGVGSDLQGEHQDNSCSWPNCACRRTTMARSGACGLWLVSRKFREAPVQRVRPRARSTLPPWQLSPRALDARVRPPSVQWRERPTRGWTPMVC